MIPLKICVIGNLSDTRCGINNVTQQTLTALQRAGHVVTAFDGTYSTVYRRREAGQDPFFPMDLNQYDVVHLVWHAMTLNHYSGVDWPRFADLPHGGPIRSFWNNGPADASCPFLPWMTVKWSASIHPDHHQIDYPVPDWVPALPTPDLAFTVGASSIRGDGVAELQQVCHAHGWAMNLPDPAVWLSPEDEIRRLARSTVNVCWYRTSAAYVGDRASAPSMLLAAGRPLLINHDHLLAHLWNAPDLYHGTTAEGDLAACLTAMAATADRLQVPQQSAASRSWSRAVDRMTTVWTAVRNSATTRDV